MRRLGLVAALGALWLGLFAIPAFADAGPHMSGANTAALSGSCAGCHRAHSGQAPFLLKDTLPNLCYSCHGAGGVGASSDVQDGVGYLSGSAPNPSTAHGGTFGVGGGASAVVSATVQPLRGGGFEYALIDASPAAGVAADSNATIGTLSAGAPTNSSHSVDGTAVTMWGYGPNVTPAKYTGLTNVALTCASCHDPHGNGQYRILKPGPDSSYTTQPARGVTAPVLGGVYINDSVNKSYVVPATGGYGVLGESTADNTIDGALLNTNGSALQYDTATKAWSGTYLEASSRWCATCHSRYMGYSGSAGNASYTVNGTGDALYKFKHAVYDIVDPLTNSIPGAFSGVVTPIGDGTNMPTQVDPTAVLGSYTSGGLTYRGVAVVGGADGARRTGYTKVLGDLLTTHAPRCITCHISHGTNAIVGASATTGQSLVTGTIFGTDSSLLRYSGRGACQSCHKK